MISFGRQYPTELVRWGASRGWSEWLKGVNVWNQNSNKEHDITGSHNDSWCPCRGCLSLPVHANSWFSIFPCVLLPGISFFLNPYKPGTRPHACQWGKILLQTWVVGFQKEDLYFSLGYHNTWFFLPLSFASASQFLCCDLFLLSSHMGQFYVM